jgi:hypothetical protein
MVEAARAPSLRRRIDRGVDGGRINGAQWTAKPWRGRHGRQCEPTEHPVPKETAPAQELTKAN